MTDRSEVIIGYPVATKVAGELLALIEQWISGDSSRCKYFVCANPHSLVTADRDPMFREAILHADLVTPDGAGIVLASRMLGGSITERVTGSDIFWGLNRQLNERGGASCFFLGSTPSTLAKIRSKMAQDFPNIEVVGTYSPPFKAEFDEADNERMIKAINAVRPDVLWVGMTAPKQEKWIYRHIDRLDVKFAGAIGAVFDFYVGNVQRSHPVFQRLGLEWLPRLIQEPRRLWRRNFVSSPLFLYKVFSQKLKNE